MTYDVAIIHPDMGIGGAEQLIVSLAVSLKNKGHNVTIFTPYHDSSRCFKETIDGSLNIVICGGLFPQTVFGRFKALCTLMRMLIASFYVLLFGGGFNAIIVDQTSGVMPLLRFSPAKLIFYCHYPDQLLCQNRQGMRAPYRSLLDSIEALGMRFAEEILVNSNFTKGVVLSTFPSLKKKIQVLYPCVTIKNNFEEIQEFKETEFFLSVNRYERKKDIGLAIRSFAKMKNPGCKLIVGGGYDPRLQENIEHFDELVLLATQLKLQVTTYPDNYNDEAPVVFMRNVPEPQRNYLMKNALGVIYTPENEHFGIVPIESMGYGTPVIAHCSGGPLETIVDQETGFILEKQVELWTQAMESLMNKEKRNLMGQNGIRRVFQMFSLQNMGEELEAHIAY